MSDDTENKNVGELLDQRAGRILEQQNIAARIEEAVTADQIQAAQFAGMVQGITLVQKLATVSTFKTLAQIKESKQYKGSKLLVDGKVLTVSTWDEYCEACGLSRQTVDENILNLSALGEQFLEYSQKIGLGYRELRKLRKLPEDQRTVVIEQIEIDAGDKEAIVSLIDDLAAKHAKEKEAKDKQIADLKGDLEAKAKLIAAKNEKIDELATKLHQQEINPPTPDEKAARLRAEVAKLADHCKATIMTSLRKGIIDLRAQDSEQGIDHDLFLAGCLAEIEREIHILRADFGLRETPSADPTPEWMKDGPWKDLAATN